MHNLGSSSRRCRQNWVFSRMKRFLQKCRNPSEFLAHDIFWNGIDLMLFVAH